MKDIFLLDLDETLLDFVRAERRNLFETLTRFGIKTGDGVGKRFHEINDGLWKALERGEVTREELVVKRFAILFGEFGIHADPAAVADAYYRNFLNVCIPYDGAKEFVAALAARGRVYLVTNGGAAVQRRHIEDAGFSPYLSGAFISEELGTNKPSRAYAALVEAGIPAFSRERAVWVGDSLTSDMVCAERMGVDFLLFAPCGAPEGYEGRAVRGYAEALGAILSDPL